MVFKKAFTIVELLVVVIVIAILVAVSIVSYSSISTKAVKSGIFSDLAQAAKQLEASRVASSSDAYPSDLTVASISSSANTTFTYYSPSGNNNYCLEGSSGGIVFSISSTNPKVQETSCISNGRVLLLDAADTNSYSGTGNNWYDISGKGRVALKGGSQSPTYPLWSSGYFNFTGGVVGNNYSRFDVANIPSFSNVSASIWFRTSAPSSGDTLMRMDNSDIEISLVRLAAGTDYYDINVFPSITGYANGQWHNLALTFDGIRLTAYYDGNLVAANQRASRTSTAAGTLRIGTRDDAYSNHHVGDISIVVLYERTLSAAEMLQHFNYYKTRYGL